ncbi:hypothetical protein [Sandaracinobacteroides hominis]|uniref:hypothetical protein n=1 Tax=Sandaracinobacteroides hominis TaxID=2780086 RepID=UPI0018F6F2F4|nr:hypothetical protein [Sandaracinobacteroides hominis]
MSITFRIADSATPMPVPSAAMSLDTFRAIIELLTTAEKRQRQSLMTWHYGHPTYYEPGDAICVTVIASAIPLAALCAPTGQDAAFIAIADEAQWNKRQIEFRLTQGSSTIHASVSEDQDSVPALEVSSQNGYAILHALGLSETSIGSITLRQLRATFRAHQFRIEGLFKYLPGITAFSEFDGDPDRTRMEWS